MRRTAALVLIPAALMLTASPAFADEATETKPVETVVVEPEYRGDLSVNFSKAIVDGRETYRIPRDVPVTLVVDVYNPNEEAVTDVALQFENRDGEIHWPNRNASVDRIDGYGSAQVEVEVLILSRDECVDDDNTTGTITSSRGESKTEMYLPVACPGPRLYQSMIEYKGGDGDGSPEPGERLEMWVTYGNWGADPATEVRGTLTISSEGVRVIEGSATWPTIAAMNSDGVAGEATQTTPFIIEIAADAPTSDGGCGWDGGGPVVIDDGTSGGGSDGSTGTGTSSGGSVSSGTVEPDTTDEAPTADQDPAADEPAPPPAEAPVSSEEEERRAQQPEEQADPVATFEGTLKIVAAETTLDDSVGSYSVCMLADGASTGGGAVDEGQLGAPEAARDVDLTASGADDNGSSTGSAALVAAFLAGIATAAWFVIRRRVLTR